MKDTSIPYWWVSDDVRKFMSRGYLVEGNSVEDRVKYIAQHVKKVTGIDGIDDRVEEAVAKGWMSLSTPIWSNFCLSRGLPISCFGSLCDDKMESIVDTWAEVSIQTKNGGGTAIYGGKLRGRGSNIKDNGKSGGFCEFAKVYQSIIQTVNQGDTRRGNIALYYPIDGPDIEEFLTFHDVNSDIKHCNFAVCVPEGWMQSMIDGDIPKRKLWAKVIDCRRRKGLPYVTFVDNANNCQLTPYGKNGDKHKILHSQLCNEVLLPTTPEESFVCCLLSMNDYCYNDWKDTNAVETATIVLDAVMSEFIEKSASIKYLEKAHRFAVKHRALGIGRLGYHSYLQKNNVAFGSMQANRISVQIQEQIYKQSIAASEMLGRMFGIPEVCQEFGLKRRNATLCAVAPTKSSAFILGDLSRSIEPVTGNYISKDLAKGRFIYKNPILKDLLASRGKDTDEIWLKILQDEGSVRSLDFLNENEKNVFKTFREIYPKDIIVHASLIQKWIDQGISLNLFYGPSASAKDIYAHTVEAWRLGIKGLYYQNGKSAVKDSLSDINGCSSCES